MSFARLSAFLLACAVTALAIPTDGTIVARDVLLALTAYTLTPAGQMTPPSARLSSIPPIHTEAHMARPRLHGTIPSLRMRYNIPSPACFNIAVDHTGRTLLQGYASASASVSAWGDEGKQYSCSNPGFSSATGHFTQLVWKSTTKVGCGRVNCNGSNGTPGWYLTCEYSPAGNYRREQ
ncbi:CAP domain-containing protein [Armillaria novae-zelandiae]|uniref:CAP domain-containing protein n=1 Tax=Armillaria novae-zelandiae TaxID=153914 RepID=A0AA39P941_9AGAR|nr:CAP domain-containing protein [Armillaria novae-zelandiae]